MHRRTPPNVAGCATRHYQPLVIVLASTSGGLVADRFLPIPFGAWFALSVAGLGAWSFVRRANRGRPIADRAAGVALLAATACLGGAWHHARWRLFSIDDLGNFAVVEPRSVCVEGTLVDAPRTTASAAASPIGSPTADDDAKTRFTIRVERLRDGVAWRPVVGLADVQIDGRWEAAGAGDRIRLYGRLSRSSPPLNPGEFDFAAHYRAERKLCLLRTAGGGQAEVIDRRATFDFGSQLAALRRRAQSLLLEFLPGEQVGFASALLLGYRDQMERRDNWAFFRTGTVHILSISGLHIAILALFLHWALRLGWLRRTTATLVTVGVTAAYALLIDAEPPAVRATIVVVLAAVASIAGRRPLNLNVLAGSALVVLALNPSDLFRAGPQLSFLAAAVLARAANRREPPELDDDPTERLRQGFWRRWTVQRMAALGGMLLTSTAIFVVTTPLVAHRFHIMSPISLLLTPVLALPVAGALLFGFLTLTLGWFAPTAAAATGAICGGCLRGIDFVVERTQHWPGAAFWLPGPGLGQTISFYALLAAWAAIPASTWRRRIAAFGVVAFGAIGLVPHHDLPPDCRTRATFIAVGHGLSVLVERRDPQTGAAGAWLYDCGRLGSEESAARSISGVLWSRGITRLDGIVVSHADADHYNALPYLLEQFRVERVWLSRALHDSFHPTAAAIKTAAAQCGVAVEAIAADEALPWPALRDCRVLHPPAGGVAGTDNAQSIVLCVESPGVRILLTGDVEGEGLAQLLARPPIDCDVVLAPHHGSGRSNPPGLADWSRPEWVVVSGTSDRDGAVRAAYELVGARVLETTDGGAVTIVVGADSPLSVDCFRTGRQ